MCADLFKVLPLWPGLAAQRLGRLRLAGPVAWRGAGLVGWRMAWRLVWRPVWRLAVLLALGLAGPARAQAVAPPAPEAASYAPSEAWAAQLAEVQGQVWLLDRGAAPADGRYAAPREWLGVGEQGLQNWPLGRGDRLRTDTGARVTLRVASLSVRLDQDSELEILQLDAQRLSFRLWQGQAAWHVLDDAQARRLELLSDAAQAQPQRAGHYRLAVDGQGMTATVWRGELRLSAQPDDWLVGAGRRLSLRADGAGGWQAERGPSQPDAFAERVLAEARGDAAPQVAQHVSAELSGWQALAREGEWREDPQWGTLWVPPPSSPGWAPYRDGRWAWVAPWGWTWIDAAPWGFVTFHYGQWVPWRGAWAWAPAPRGSRPRFQPVQPGWQRPAPPRHPAPPPGADAVHGHQRPPAPEVLPPRLPRPAPRGEAERPDVPTPRVPRFLPPRAMQTEPAAVPTAPAVTAPGASVTPPLLPAPVSPRPAWPERQDRWHGQGRQDRQDRQDREDRQDRQDRQDRHGRPEWPSTADRQAPAERPAAPAMATTPAVPAMSAVPAIPAAPAAPRVAPAPRAPSPARPAADADAAQPRTRLPREGRANEATR